MFLFHIMFYALLLSSSLFAAAAKSLQSCLTLCDHRDSSPPGSHPWDSPGKNTGVGCHFLLQCMKVKSESEVTQSCPTLATPWTVAHQAPLSMGFSSQEYWSGVPLPSQHLYMTTGKTIAFTIQTFVGKVMSLLFNMLSGLVIIFLPGISVFLFHGCNYHLQ